MYHSRCIFAMTFLIEIHPKFNLIMHSKDSTYIPLFHKPEYLLHQDMYPAYAVSRPAAYIKPKVSWSQIVKYLMNHLYDMNRNRQLLPHDVVLPIFAPVHNYLYNKILRKNLLHTLFFLFPETLFSPHFHDIILQIPFCYISSRFFIQLLSFLLLRN